MPRAKRFEVVMFNSAGCAIDNRYSDTIEGARKHLTKMVEDSITAVEAGDEFRIIDRETGAGQ